MVARELKQRPIRQKASKAGDEHRRCDRERIGQVCDVGQVPSRVGTDHHELPEGEVHNARDAKGQRDPERDDTIERPDDDAVEDLPENYLGHWRLGSGRWSAAADTCGWRSGHPLARSLAWGYRAMA